MCIGEKSPAAGEPVDARRLHLRMPLEAADPIIQIVNRDKQDIGPIGRCAGRSGSEEQNQRQGAAGEQAIRAG